jgi:hypothetical protein
MPQETIYAAVAAFVGALIALLIYHLAVVRPTQAWMSRMLGLHDGLIAGGEGGAADRFGSLEEAHAGTDASIKELGDRLGALETLARTDVSRAGFVRYDAFTDAESGLSYALALLNREGDGVVLTSIYSRTDTRTFGKPVASFKPTVHASSEELEAIDRARTS